MSVESNPGAATPHSLHKLYTKNAACTGNPFVLSSINAKEQTILLLRQPRPPAISRQPPRRRSDSPPKAPLRVLSETSALAAPKLSLTLHCLGAKS
jgi:hypothetical protein